MQKQILILFLLSDIQAVNRGYGELPIRLTDEEKTRIHEIYTMGRNTDPPPIPIRNVAEFERMQGVIIRYPFGISSSIIAEMSENVTIYCLVSSSQQNSAENTMENGGVNMNNVEFVLGNTDSYWTRDYGPWWVVDGQRNMSIVDFTYNRPRPNDNETPWKISAHLSVPYYATDIIHAGGNYMTDGLGISASSTLVFEENEISNDSLLEIMQDYYGIESYHVLADPNNTYIDHIDCWGKYLSPHKVLIREVPTWHAQYDEIEEVADYFSNSLMGKRRPWIIISTLMMSETLIFAAFLTSQNIDPLILGITLFSTILATSILDVATDGMAIDILNENERGFVNGLMWAFRTLGVSISAIFSSVIINNYGLGEAIFYLGIIIALIGILLFFINHSILIFKNSSESKFF